MTSEKLTKIAQIIDAHGIKGEVKLRSFSENLEIFTSNLILFDVNGKNKFAIRITGKAKNSIIVKIDGINDRNAAELLKNTELFIPSSALPETTEGELYSSDLIGLKVRLANGDEFGVINAIHNFGAGDISEITTISGNSEMLPLSEPWIAEINIKEGYVIVVPAEYL